MAAELHDSLGQGLLVVKNYAFMGLKETATPEKMREQLREISEILDLPESTIHSRIAVALGQITRILEPKLRDPIASRPKQFPQAVL